MKSCFHYGDKLLKNDQSRLNDLEKIALIGAGTMGTGIAIDLLDKTGLNIVMLDISEEALEGAEKDIREHFENLVERGQILEEDISEYTERASYTKDYGVLGDVDVIWEIATEKMEIKREIFGEIEKNADPAHLEFIFSNTSSHTTSELAQLFEDKFIREKFLTGHGYYPFQGNRLFDVMKGKYATGRTFRLGVAFAEQFLEKKVISLKKDHHGYIADPIFVAMSAIISWDVEKGQDLVELPLVFKALTANPFEVLDGTGHMPYTESCRHMGEALPDDDRLKGIYNKNGKRYPDWIKKLKEEGKTGKDSEENCGFFHWEDGEPAGVFDPKSGEYKEIEQINWKEFWSIKEAEALDQREGMIKSTEGLIKIAESDDRSGKSFRRYVVPLMLYALDLIQDGYATPGDINTSTREGLRFKHGLSEIIDEFLDHFGLDGFMGFVKKSAEENPDLKHLFDIDGDTGPREGKPSFLHRMKKEGWGNLLGYGRIYGTPVSQLNPLTGDMEIFYNDLRFVYPNAKDRIASIIFDNPLRGNVWNRYTLDQLDHAVGVCRDLYKKGDLGGIFFSAAGKNMGLFGAEARYFNEGWFDPKTGYEFPGEDHASYFSEAGMKIFRYIQESPILTTGAFGEKWGGGAEFTYFLDQRFDLDIRGVEFDTIEREMAETQKNTYNQPELDYSILAGFGAVQELRRLGLGDSQIDELFIQGMTATRAYQVGLSNGVNDDPFELLQEAYEALRLKVKYATPYPTALYNKQKKDSLEEGQNDERLIKQTGETFNPEKNPYVSVGILRLLNRGGRTPDQDFTVRGELPGWEDEYDELF